MKAAILIDGGYLLKRLPSLRPDVAANDAAQVDHAIGQLVDAHLRQLNQTACQGNPQALLYRCFYYDALPYRDRGHLPISKKAIDYGKSDLAVFRLALFDLLRRRPSFAVRLGEVRRERGWILKDKVQADLLAGRKQVADLTDADFEPGFRQKAVDMRIGVDIASITLKRQADTVVLVAGDSDFVPAAKLARREGMRVILDPLGRSVEAGLFEHIDAVQSGLTKPDAVATAPEEM